MNHLYLICKVCVNVRVIIAKKEFVSLVIENFLAALKFYWLGHCKLMNAVLKRCVSKWICSMNNNQCFIAVSL